MKTRIVVIGLLMSMVAGAALADTWHLATAPTKREAMRIATASARDAALRSRLCYKPAGRVDKCEKVEGGYRCRADSAERVGACYRRGWLSDSKTSIVPNQSILVRSIDRFPENDRMTAGGYVAPTPFPSTPN